MVRDRFRSYILAAMLGALAALSPAATIVGGLEDTPGSSGYEKNGDFNDMMFELTGNVTINAPGGVFNNLAPSVVNQNGTVFWDNPSLDGPDKNISYMLLGDSQFQNLQYLALPGGGSVNYVVFDATGPVTLTYLGGIAADRQVTLGWYSLADPGMLHQLAAVTEPPGETIAFNPDGEFALYASTGDLGQFYSSIAASNIGDRATQQHFAFFEEPQGASQVPESSSGTLAGIGVALLGFGLLPRRNRRV